MNATFRRQPFFTKSSILSTVCEWASSIYKMLHNTADELFYRTHSELFSIILCVIFYFFSMFHVKVISRILQLMQNYITRDKINWSGLSSIKLFGLLGTPWNALTFFTFVSYSKFLPTLVSMKLNIKCTLMHIWKSPDMFVFI